MIIILPTWHCGGHTSVGSERGGEATLEEEGGRRTMKCINQL